MKQFSLSSLFLLVLLAAIVCWLAFNVYPFGSLIAWFLVASLIGLFAGGHQAGWLGVVCGLMFLFGVLAIPYYMMDGHAVAPHRLEGISVGASADDVRSLLGPPKSKRAAASGEEWIYGGWTWCVIQVSFDDRGIVDYVEHDH